MVGETYAELERSLGKQSTMIDVDVWVRGRQDAATEKIVGISQNAAAWTDVDVKKLLEGMLLALERVNNPGGIPPEVTLRGFSWIVSPDTGGVLLHLEMQLGTVSAGPFSIEEQRFTEMIARVLGGPKVSTLIH
jgi:hypothetical protein